jgi:hypothetical protein
MILVEGGKEKELKHPIVDPFWKAFYQALNVAPPQKKVKSKK